MKLIIVESPHKCQTLNKILGSEYKILATKGHIMVINNTGAYNTGIDTDNEFKISYIFDSTKKEDIKRIKEAAKEADEIFVCSDDDREGHKISDEVRELLKGQKKKLKRAVFNEITDKAVKNAIANPIPFDENMIQAAEARASVDRLMGFRLSPLALRKLGCESAGRVQSALLKLICEKEESIKNFKPSKYFEVFLEFEKDNATLTAKLREINGKKVEKFTDQIIVNDVLENCKSGNYFVDEINEKEKLIEPKLPLTTAAMQQVASNNLGFSPERTMAAAQHLFESGYITYLRTDAVRYSDDFIESAKEFIIKKYGKELYRGLNIPESKNENAQNAHESIRMTDLDNTPEKLSQLLDDDERKLYKLIYNYSLATLFVPAKVKDTDVIIKNDIYRFKISGRVVTFESFLKLFNSLEDDDKKLPLFKQGEKIIDKALYFEEKETQPPQRYSEAGLVKLMEQTGIGRPSSYSSTIKTLKKREYIAIDKKSVIATDKGIKLNKMLAEYFPTFINTEYTAGMENDLDKISSGSETKLKFLTSFWNEFEPTVSNANREIVKDKPKAEKAEGQMCPECGKQLVYRINKKGEKFLACSGFPKCHYSASLTNKASSNATSVSCPQCGEGVMVKRTSKKGDVFYGCSRFTKGCKCTMTEAGFKDYVNKQLLKDPFADKS